MKHKSIVLKLIIFTLLFCKSVLANSLRIITVNEAPANFIDNNGNKTGYALDVVQLLQQELKVDADIEFMPEARALNLAKTKPNILLFSFSRTPARENQFHWVGKVMEKTWRVFTLSSSEINIRRFEDLYRLDSIGVVRGDIRQEWLASKSFSNLSLVTRHKQNLKMLLKGRIDTIVHESHAIAYLMEELNVPRTSLKPVFDINKSDVYILLSKSTNLETVRAWQSAFTQLKSSKQLQHIAKSWRLKISQELKVGAKVKDGILVL